MIYERMKYAHDQRAWVKAADEKLPVLRATAIKMQLDAAAAFKEWSDLTWESKRRYKTLQSFHAEIYAKSRYATVQVLYYEGMRRANLPESES